MITFTVHEPPNAPADRVERAAGMAFVRDGFSWSAALFTPLWLLAHRLWWPLLGYAAVAGGLELARHNIAIHPGWLSLATLAMSLVIGFEAGTLRRWALARRGWITLGAVSGRNAEECERRFFDMWLSAPPVPPPQGDDGLTRRSLRGALAAAQA
jgi:hypothetical protein